jgi:DNA-binding XRE family transcriptional regulator
MLQKPATYLFNAMTQDEPVPGRKQTLPALQGPLSDQNRVLCHLLANNVRHFRHMKNKSQEALASESGIYRTYLSRIESGRSNPSLSVLIALAAALEILPHALLLPIE